MILTMRGLKLVGYKTLSSFASGHFIILFFFLQIMHIPRQPTNNTNSSADIAPTYLANCDKLGSFYL